MPETAPLVIFAEDDLEDWDLIKEVLEECEECRSGALKYEHVVDGVALMERLTNPVPQKPDMVMLDLKMPKKDGAESLEEIRANPELRHIPVIILTTSRLEADIFEAYHRGANSYVVKPVTHDTIKQALHDIQYYWTKVAVKPSKNHA